MFLVTFTNDAGNIVIVGTAEAVNKAREIAARHALETNTQVSVWALQGSERPVRTTEWTNA